MHNWLLNLLTINSQYRQQIHFVPKYRVQFPFTHMLQDSCKARSYRAGDLWYPGDRKESLPVCVGTQSPVTHSRCGASREHLLWLNKCFHTTHATFLQGIHRGRNDLIAYRTLISKRRKKVGKQMLCFIIQIPEEKELGVKLAEL